MEFMTICVSVCVQMRGLHFLFSVLPVEEILTSLTSLINPHVQRLDTLAHQEPSPTTKLCIIHILGMMSSLFTTLDISRQDQGSDGTTPAQARPNSVSLLPTLSSSLSFALSLTLSHFLPFSVSEPLSLPRTIVILLTLSVLCQVVLVLQPVFTLSETILSKWLSDSEVVKAV
ncbi:importin-13-like isoform 2-T2 [Salvelinus alpinus]